MKHRVRGTSYLLLILALICIGVNICFSAPPEWIQQQRTPTTQNRVGKRVGCVSIRKGYDGNLDCLESFIEDQLNMFGHEEGNLPQTYRVGWDFQPPRPGYSDTFGYELSMRADVYDAAMSAIFLMNRNKLDLARRICDTLIFVVDNDPVGDGRSRASYYPVSPIMNQYIPGVSVSYYTKIKDGTVTVGNLAFQVLALGRFYHITKEYRYLRAATKIMYFINKELRATTPLGGFYGGFSHDPNTKEDKQIEWRSIEHNLDIVASARLMYGLTKNELYNDMLKHADKFVQGMWNDQLGTYHIGTVDKIGDDSLSTAHFPVDAVTWKILAEADNDPERNKKAVDWVIDNLIVSENQVDGEDGKDYSYKGVIFSRSGQGIHSENTAAAALAFYKLSKDVKTTTKKVKESADEFLKSLIQMQKHAENSDGNGIVASLDQEGALVWQGDEFAGESWRYFPFPHTVATAWTGLAIQYSQGDDYANPYADFSKKDVKYIQVAPIANPIAPVTPSTGSGKDVEDSTSKKTLDILSFTSLGIASVALCCLCICLCVVVPLNIIFCVRLISAKRRVVIKKKGMRERADSRTAMIQPTNESATYTTEQ